MFLSRLFSAALATITLTSLAFAEDTTPQSPWTIDSNVGFFSNYMFRGQTLYDGPSIQPSLAATYDTGMGEISANLWMHISGNSRPHAERYTELDETLKYSYTFDALTASVGNAWYTYSDRGDGSNIEDTAEYFASLAYDAYLAPTLSYYNDWRVYHSQYYELAFSHEYSDVVGNGSNLTPFIAFGFASNAEKIYADDGLVQITTGVSTNLAMGDITVTPTLDYSFKVDENTINQFWFGVTFAYSK